VAESVWGEGGTGRPKMFQGYYFRVLKGQGASVPGGEKLYNKNGHWSEGWAVVAFPVEYDVTAKMTYIVSNHGKIYEKDLGPDGFGVASAMASFDPTGWNAVDPKRAKAAPPGIEGEQAPGGPVQPRH
jgi:hypothetical protein